MSGNDDLIALLQAGDIDGFNEQRRNRSRLEMFAVDLSGLKLTGADLSGASMEKADLSGADLTDTILTRADLSGADLSETNLTGAMAIGLKLRDAFVEDTIFDEADLSQSDFSDTELHRCSFRESILARSKFKRCTFVSCDFTAADANESKFSGSTTEECTFRAMQLKEASMKGTKLQGANLSKADLTQARLHEADFTDADLTGATLALADLTGANLTGAKLEGARLRRADLSGAKLEGAVLDGAELTEAEVDAALHDRAWQHAPDLGPPLLQDARWACDGTHVAATWLDTDGEGRSWLRVGVCPLAGPTMLEAPTLPVPADLILANGITATSTGFQVLVLVERPGGSATWMFPVSKEGVVGTGIRADIPFRPMVRPLLQPGPKGAIDIYAIGGQGPILLVLRAHADGKLEVLHNANARTARGFASDHHPVLLTKGGTLELIVPGKPSRAVSAPSDFPGRSPAVVPLQADDPAQGLVLAWVPSSARGLQVVEAVPSMPMEVDTYLKKVPVGQIDGARSGKHAWVVFTRPDELRPRRLAAWAMKLPDGKPIEVAGATDRSARAVHMIPNPKVAVAVVSWDDESATLYRLDDEGGHELWSI